MDNSIYSAIHETEKCVLLPVGIVFREHRWNVCQYLCALTDVLIALQWKFENLLGEKQSKFTETSTPPELYRGVLVLLKFYWAPGIVEFVLGRFSHFYIAIAYSNSTFCGTWTPSFYEFTWKLSKFQQNEHTPWCSFRWILAVFHRAGFHTFIVMLWEKQSRCTRICTQISKTSTPQVKTSGQRLRK